MAEFDQKKKKSAESRNSRDNAVDENVPTVNSSNDELMKATDELLEEIDAVLEPFGEEFAAAYRQVGGE